jgi:hypothetical protein
MTLYSHWRDMLAFALARYARGRLALADFSPAEIACRRTRKLLVNKSVLD